MNEKKEDNSVKKGWSLWDQLNAFCFFSIEILIHLFFEADYVCFYLMYSFEVDMLKRN